MPLKLRYRLEKRLMRLLGFVNFNLRFIMKIGIITFWESNNNYGQILQLYAMQSALQKMEHSPFLIQYHRVRPVVKKPFLQRLVDMNVLASVKYHLTGTRRKKALMMDEKRGFKEFKNKYILFGETHYYNLDELRQNPPEADVYITGSDQVWNHTFFVSPETFLLGFGEPGVKRISYAASYGVKSQDVDTQSMFKQHLGAFSGISVREQSGVGLTEQLGFKAEWVLDPTMLFTKEEWIKLLKLQEVGENPGEKKDQVFIYTLGNSKIRDKDKFIKYAKGLKAFDVVHATANDDFSGNAYPTIPEWVYHISTSRLVITTSFHGMIFCILNNTNFVVLPNTGHAEGMNERVESMLGALGLSDHLMPYFDEEKINALVQKETNWKYINEKLLSWRRKSYDFLNRHLDFK